MSGTTLASIKLAWIYNRRLMSKLCPYSVSPACAKLSAENLGKYWDVGGKLNTVINSVSNMKRLTAK